MTSMNLQFRSDLPQVKTIVVKVGSRILASDSEEERSARMVALVDSIAALHRGGVRTVLVSSGAIAYGVQALGLEKKPSEIPLKQACASIGQIRLMNRYAALFENHGLLAGQVLLTWADLRDKVRYLNLRNTLFSLLETGSVPIINENDSTGVDEIKFGDNDTLGAQMAMLMGADLFINLTDLNGLYTANPKKDPDATQIPLVKKVTPAIHRLADAEGTTVGTGGMVTKLRAADTLSKAGIACIIGDGYHYSLADVLRDPALGTLFLPAPEKMSSRHRFLAFTGRSAGTLHVDDGARAAIENRGKSLLAAGIATIEGNFHAGDMVDIAAAGGSVFARGIVNYPAPEVARILGHSSSELGDLLGDDRVYPVVVHRDNLVRI